MGHYASEIMGEGPSEDERLGWIKSEEASLAATWQNGLRMAVAYPHSKREYTCPSCYATVQNIFLSHHDEWHEKLKKMMEDIARWTTPGLIG